MKHLVGKTNKVYKQVHYKQQEPHDIGNKLQHEKKRKDVTKGNPT